MNLSKKCEVCHTYLVQDYKESDRVIREEDREKDGSHCPKCSIKYVKNVE